MSNASEKNPIYLDYAATTPLDEEVLEAMMPYLTEKFGNISSVHSWGQGAKQGVVEAREKIAEFLNCDDEEIIFTSGGTESANLAIKGVASANKDKGRHIVSSKIEHHAVLEPLARLESEGFEVSYVDVDENGFVNPKDVEAALREDTILVSVMYANNEMGAIQPIKEIAEIVKAKEIPLHTDACQATGALSLDVEELGVDLMTVNAGKIYGPKGAGLLYVRDGVFIDPIIEGGGQEFGLRGGTENVAAIVGFAKAMELAVMNRDKENARLIKLRDKLIDGLLEKVDECCLNGSREKRLPNNVNVSFIGVEGESMLLRLDMEKVAVSSGSACTSNDLEPSHVLRAMGLSDERTYSSIRFSLGKSTTEEDINQVLDRVLGVVRDLRGISF